MSELRDLEMAEAEAKTKAAPPADNDSASSTAGRPIEMAGDAELREAPADIVAQILGDADRPPGVDTTGPDTRPGEAAFEDWAAGHVAPTFEIPGGADGLPGIGNPLDGLSPGSRSTPASLLDPPGSVTGASRDPSGLLGGRTPSFEDLKGAALGDDGPGTGTGRNPDGSDPRIAGGLTPDLGLDRLAPMVNAALNKYLDTGPTEGGPPASLDDAFTPPDDPETTTPLTADQRRDLEALRESVAAEKAAAEKAAAEKAAAEKPKDPDEDDDDTMTTGEGGGGRGGGTILYDPKDRSARLNADTISRPVNDGPGGAGDDGGGYLPPAHAGPDSIDGPPAIHTIHAGGTPAIDRPLTAGPEFVRGDPGGNGLDGTASGSDGGGNDPSTSPYARGIDGALGADGGAFAPWASAGAPAPLQAKAPPSGMSQIAPTGAEGATPPPGAEAGAPGGPGIASSAQGLMADGAGGGGGGGSGPGLDPMTAGLDAGGGGGGSGPGLDPMTTGLESGASTAGRSGGQDPSTISGSEDEDLEDLEVQRRTVRGGDAGAPVVSAADAGPGAAIDDAIIVPAFDRAAPDTVDLAGLGTAPGDGGAPPPADDFSSSVMGGLDTPLEVSATSAAPALSIDAAAMDVSVAGPAVAEAALPPTDPVELKITDSVAPGDPTAGDIDFSPQEAALEMAPAVMDAPQTHQPALEQLDPGMTANESPPDASDLDQMDGPLP